MDTPNQTNQQTFTFTETSLNHLLRQPISFHRIFAEITGSAVAGIFLSQMWYWTQRTRHPDGWIYKTYSDWWGETALRRKEIDKARKRLRELGLLHESLCGVPATLHYRLNLPTLYEAITHGARCLDTTDVLTMYHDDLERMSQAAYMRAIKTCVDAEYAPYADVLSEKGMTCGICTREIVKGPGKRGDTLTFAYITPLEAGGAHTTTNIHPVHMQCAKGTVPQESAPDTPSTPADSPPEAAPVEVLADLPQETPSQFAYSKQTSLLIPSKPVCLFQANQFAYSKQTISEITSETTTEITAEDLPSVFPTGKTSSTLDAATLMAMYNDLTPPGHPKVTKLTPAREKKARKLLRAFPERAFWETVFTEIVHSPLLLGHRPTPHHPHFKGDFDWLLATGRDGTENCVKVAEGKYRPSWGEHALESVGTVGLHNMQVIQSLITEEA